MLARDQPEWGPEEIERVGRELLARLDPWSYWLAVLSADAFGDFAVVGTTGAFLVAVCGLEGPFHAEGDRLTVGGRPLGGLREARGAARRAKAKLHDAAVFTEVRPLICLSRAIAGAPLSVRGVRVVGLADLVSEITSRESTLVASRAKRGAEVLGRVLSTGTGARSEREGEGEEP